eukprot:m.793010 g.793010  ORF g.793010 m.793010 type:complete len:142 (+) comp23333_c0_seq8:1602-2027(+)
MADPRKAYPLGAPLAFVHHLHYRTAPHNRLIIKTVSVRHYCQHVCTCAVRCDDPTPTHALHAWNLVLFGVCPTPHLCSMRVSIAVSASCAIHRRMVDIAPPHLTTLISCFRHTFAFHAIRSTLMSVQKSSDKIMPPLRLYN